MTTSKTTFRPPVTSRSSPYMRSDFSRFTPDALLPQTRGIDFKKEFIGQWQCVHEDHQAGREYLWVCIFHRPYEAAYLVNRNIKLIIEPRNWTEIISGLNRPRVTEWANNKIVFSDDGNIRPPMLADFFEECNYLSDSQFPFPDRMTHYMSSYWVE